MSFRDSPYMQAVMAERELAKEVSRTLVGPLQTPRDFELTEALLAARVATNAQLIAESRAAYFENRMLRALEEVEALQERLDAITTERG